MKHDFPCSTKRHQWSLSPLSEVEAHFWERESTGVNTRSHLLGYYRAALNAQGVIPSIALGEYRNGETVQVAGQIVMHEAPPTAKGVHFVTLGDEAELINLVIQAEVYQRVKTVVRGNSMIRVTGQVQRRGQWLVSW